MHQFQCVSDGNAVLSSHNEEELKLTLHQKQQQQQQQQLTTTTIKVQRCVYLLHELC